MMSDQIGPDQEQTERRAKPNIETEVAEGVVKGFKLLLKDKELSTKFWQIGFDELSVRVRNGVSQWIGKRIMTWAISSISIAGLIWLFKSGAIK